VIVNGGFESALEICAPINFNGSIIRRIGRDESDESPVKVALNFCPASKPASMRIVDPLLPQLSGWLGSLNPPNLTPAIETRPCSLITGTPNACKQLKVEAQSWLVEKFSNSDVPVAIAARIAARCDIDLSPGSDIEPRILLAGFIRI
jgi:hypothetical protein